MYCCTHNCYIFLLYFFKVQFLKELCSLAQPMQHVSREEFFKVCGICCVPQIALNWFINDCVCKKQILFRAGLCFYCIYIGDFKIKWKFTFYCLQALTNHNLLPALEVLLVSVLLKLVDKWIWDLFPNIELKWLNLLGPNRT